MKRSLVISSLIVCSAICFSQKTNLPVVTAPKFKKDTVNIQKMGAVADGYFLNTKAINGAIDALSKKRWWCSIRTRWIMVNRANRAKK